MPNTSFLNRNPAAREQLAELLAEGKSYRECAPMFEVSYDTIKRGVKDKRVQQLVSELREARINRITRHTDAALEAKLTDPDLRDDLTVTEIVMIRKALAPAPTAASDGEVDPSAAESDFYRKVSAAVADDPALADRLGIAAPAPKD